MFYLLNSQLKSSTWPLTSHLYWLISFGCVKNACLQSYCGLWPEFALLNHACSPNTVGPQIHGQLQTVYCLVLRLMYASVSCSCNSVCNCVQSRLLVTANALEGQRHHFSVHSVHTKVCTCALYSVHICIIHRYTLLWGLLTVCAC